MLETTGTRVSRINSQSYAMDEKVVKKPVKQKAKYQGIEP